MGKLSDLAAGKAGEYLVCADLILKGHTAFLSEQGLPFDVIADVGGKLLRIQVKTTRGPRSIPQRKETHTPAYLYHIKRCGNGGKRVYGNGVVDLFALVALDTRDIGYLPASLARQTMMFRSSMYRGQYHDEQLKVRTDLIRTMKASGKTNAAIGRELGLDKSYVGRVLTNRSGVADTLETYLADMTFEKALAAL